MKRENQGYIEMKDALLGPEGENLVAYWWDWHIEKLPRYPESESKISAMRYVKAVNGKLMDMMYTSENYSAELGPCSTPGITISYINIPGYIVCDWKTFTERAIRYFQQDAFHSSEYNKNLQLSFSEAIEEIKSGNKVTRAGFNNTEILIFEKIIDPSFIANQTVLVCVPDYIHMRNGVYSGKIYYPTNDDKNAHDWCIVSDNIIKLMNVKHHPSGSIDLDGDIILL